MDAAFEAFLRDSVASPDYDGNGNGIADLAGLDDTMVSMQDPLSGLSDSSNLHDRGLSPEQDMALQQQQQQQQQHQAQQRLKYDASIKQNQSMQPLQTNYGNGGAPGGISTYPTPVNSAPFVPAEQQTFMSPFPIGPGNVSYNPTPLLSHESFAELDELLFTPMLSPAMTPMGSTRIPVSAQTENFEWDTTQQLFALPDSTMTMGAMQPQGPEQHQQQQQQFGAVPQNGMQRHMQTMNQLPTSLQMTQQNAAVADFAAMPTAHHGRFAVPGEHVAKKQKVASISSKTSSRQQSPATPGTGPIGRAKKRVDAVSRSTGASPAPSEAISPASLGDSSHLAQGDAAAGNQAPITPAMLMHMKQQQQQAQAQVQASPERSVTSHAALSPALNGGAAGKHGRAKSLLPRIPGITTAKRPQDLSIKLDSASSDASDTASMRSPMALPPPASAVPIRARPLSVHSGSAKDGKPHSRSKSVTSSPALGPSNPARVKASPELRPILPGGMSPQLTAMLASKSNYQHIVDGTYDQLNITYPSNMTQGLETRRTSHKAAEQKRRDHLKESFEQLRNVLADRPDAGASKIVLLKRGYEQLLDQQRHLAQKDREIEQLKALLDEHNVAIPELSPLQSRSNGGQSQVIGNGAIKCSPTKSANTSANASRVQSYAGSPRTDDEMDDGVDNQEGSGSGSGEANESGSGTPTPTHVTRRSSAAAQKA